MSEKQAEGPIYPVTLDVVDYKGEEYQVVASAQTGDPNKDQYVLKNTNTGETIRVTGAVFTPFPTRTPGIGDVYRRDEGVRVTGLIAGGETE